MPVPVLSEQDFEQQVLMSELPVGVEVFRRESNMSKTVAPEVEGAAQELEGKAMFVKVDVDRSPRIAAALRVQGIPSFAVFVRGRPVALKSDVVRKKGIVDMVEPMGAETNLYLQTGAHTVVCRSQRALDNREVGHRLQFEMDTSKAHLFDPGTGTLLG